MLMEKTGEAGGLRRAGAPAKSLHSLTPTVGVECKGPVFVHSGSTESPKLLEVFGLPRVHLRRSGRAGRGGVLARSLSGISPGSRGGSEALLVLAVWLSAFGVAARPSSLRRTLSSEL
jgi:hypothetical protein